MTVDVLGIVEAVLPANLDVGVGEQEVELIDNPGFLVGGPVPFGVASADQRDTDRVLEGPGKSDAVDVAVAGLDVEVEPQGGWVGGEET